ncbi:hypothetical protein EV207_13011 [Scopulibacillus darangshiensis]|uniref:Coat F domain-containing protein n=1 Tax=Scopulibacillus darangshiensis TaxID=442528 RepID=A0A4R2NQ47_9BACL|nr:hypothetical protein [Scopulibacillus darangshiensis]TCP23494.1 hypothetical protein EV207_13011 [Scopulibacillus darangshiensis]
MNPQQQPQNQNVMEQPPFVVSTKDHLYLEDMLSWNLNAVKKSHFFASQCQDTEIKQALLSACQMHQTHYQMLLNHIQQHVQNNTNPTTGGMQ